MNKYLEHPPVEAPFWDISNKLKDFGFSKGEFIKTKSTACGQKKWEKRKTLNGPLPLEDSSDFDDSVCVLIVMT